MVLCQATCPHCRSHLFFPADWRYLLLRCKTCGQTFREVRLNVPAHHGVVVHTQPTHPSTGGNGGFASGSLGALSATGSTSGAVSGADKANSLVPIPSAILLPTAEPLAPAPTPTSAGQLAERAASGREASAAASPPTTIPPSPYEAILARRRRFRWVKLGVAAMVLTTFALALALFWPLVQPTVSSWWARLVAVWEQARSTEWANAPDNQEAQSTGDSQDHNQGSQEGLPTGPSVTTPSKPTLEKKPNGSLGTNADTPSAPAKPPLGKPNRPSKRDFDGRALLIGIQNYFYLNPVNSGAQQHVGQLAGHVDFDPLGLRTFRRRLIGMGFRDECIGELSDVAEKNPNPPLKASIEETLKLFCEESRPQDSILVTYVGHVLVRDGKVYLAPIDAKLDSPPEKLVSLEWVYQQLGQCRARHKLVILDVAHLDPQEGVVRGKEMPLEEEAEKAIAQVPEGVLVWLSCSAKQFSYGFGGYGLVGSVFFHMLNEMTYMGPDIQGRRNRAAVERTPPFPEWDLPMLRLHARINSEVKLYLKNLSNLEQEPKLFGKLAAGPGPASNDPFPKPVALKFAPLPDKPVEAAFVDLILEEVRARISKDRPLRAAALPPFWAKDMEKYKPDYVDLNALRALLDEKPLRKAAWDALDLLDKHERQLRMSFLADANPENFRKQILREQENLALADRELFEFKEVLDKIRAEHRAQETPRWQANFDLVYARFIGRMALYREYNFVIGNRLRRDPTLQNPEKNNGWKIVPSDRLQQKETRELAKERDKILEVIVKEHPNTPWEFLAERERATSLGLKVEEARVSP